MDPNTQHGPVVDQQQFERIMGYIEQGKKSATLLTGGGRIGTKGSFIQPTIFLEPSVDSPIWTEEIFGPVLTVKTFRTEEEAVELANETEYGLACEFYFFQPILTSSNLQMPVFDSNSMHLHFGYHQSTSCVFQNPSGRGSHKLSLFTGIEHAVRRYQAKWLRT